MRLLCVKVIDNQKTVLRYFRASEGTSGTLAGGLHHNPNERLMICMSAICAEYISTLMLSPAPIALA
jgi:hypothetical protein